MRHVQGELRKALQELDRPGDPRTRLGRAASAMHTVSGHNYPEEFQAPLRDLWTRLTSTPAPNGQPAIDASINAMSAADVEAAILDIRRLYSLSAEFAGRRR